MKYILHNLFEYIKFMLKYFWNCSQQNNKDKKMKSHAFVLILTKNVWKSILTVIIQPVQIR